MQRLILIVFVTLSAYSFSKQLVEDTIIARIEAIKNEKERAKQYDDAATRSWYVGDYDKTLEYTKRGLEIAEKNNYKALQAKLLNNRGIGFDYQGDYTSSLTCYFKALRIQEKLDDSNMEANILSNIGLIYGAQELYAKALLYHNKSLDIHKRMKNATGISASLNNVAIIYVAKKDYPKAIENYSECIRIDKLIKDERGLGDDYNNIGICYLQMKEFDKAMEYLLVALEIRQRLNNPLGVSETYTNVATVNYELRQWEEAEKYFLLSIPIAQGVGSKESLKYAYQYLYQIEEELGQTDDAYNYYKLYIAYRDSIDNTVDARIQTELEMSYKYDKEKERTRLLQEKKEEKAKVILYSVIAASLLIFVFSLLLYKRWRLAKQQQQIIEDKNELVELKNQEITDSINYAKRIQTAILPSSEFITERLPNHFVTYFPKDIVAGDFYWMEEFQHRLFFAVADCTGHGVPGAMMSVVCHNALNRALRDFQLSVPGDILDKTREIIIDDLSKNDQQVTDGMDISLCVIDRNKNEIQWAGANNSLWVYSKEINEIKEWKGDKQPIGRHWKLLPFTTHHIPVHKNNRYYLFSDGYVDQFGGPNGKKLMTKTFKEWIMNSVNQDLPSQQKYLEARFKEWQGQLAQVDDVCVVCFEL